MPTPQRIDPKTLDKLRKVWAMRGSAHAGERSAAERKATQIVAAYGYSMHHVEQLLAGVPISAASEQDWKRHQERALKREAVIQRYGSEEAARAWQPREKLLRRAVERLCRFQNDRPAWTATIDGWRNKGDQPSRQAIELVSKAYPLPSSITEARAEFDYWISRNEDLRLISAGPDGDDLGNEQLDLPAILRSNIVEELLATRLRAVSVGEILLRQRYVSERGHSKEIQKALLRDLEHLAATEMPKGVQSGQDAGNVSHNNTKQRRNAVEEMLSNMDTRSLADREIARRLGVSPQTVGNIRRRLNASATRAAHSSSSRRAR